MDELKLLAGAYVVFLGLIAVEVAWSARRRDGGYRIGEAIVNVGHGVLYQVWDSFTKVLVMAPFVFVAAWVPWQTLPSNAVWGWVVGIVAYDFMSYWAHRHHHEVHVLWAIHGAHHAAEDFNLAAALRQATFQHLFKWLWKLPLALVIPVKMLVGIVVFDFLYQFVQHTRYVPKLGPLEWVFNTPSHHRVHHGREAKYLDRNYGGILIVWDRLFGTFQEEEEEPTYGLTKPLNTLNALWANLAIWAELVRASGRARGFDRVKLWFAGPGSLERLAPGVEHVESQPVANADIPLRMRVYVVATALVIPPLLAWMLLVGDVWPLAARVALGGFIVASVVALGGLVEGRGWAAPFEVARIAVGVLGFAFALSSGWPVMVGVAVGGGFWLARRGISFAGSGGVERGAGATGGA